LKITIVIVALIAFMRIQLWLERQRRLMFRRESPAAIEMGVKLPPLDPDSRSSPNISGQQRNPASRT